MLVEQRTCNAVGVADEVQLIDGFNSWAAEALITQLPFSYEVVLFHLFFFATRFTGRSHNVLHQ